MKGKLLAAMLMGMHGLLVGTAACAAALPASQNPASEDDADLGESGQNPPLIRIVNPAQGTDTNGAVRVVLKTALPEDDARLRVRLNGKDVSNAFRAAGCAGQICTKKAKLGPADGLEKGTNLLVARVGSPGTGRGGSQRVTFSYGGLRDSSSVVNYYTPVSVGFNTTANPANNLAGPWINVVTGYQNGADDPIATLPAPTSGSKTRTIAYSNMSYAPSEACLYGPSPYLGVVLDRRNPTVQEYSWCGNSAADLASSAKAALGRDLGADDLVVFGTSTVPAVDGLDTTMFGGTNYGSIFDSTAPYPYNYVMIGVMGATPGTAHEAYSVAEKTGVMPPPPTLNGTLVLDGNKHYNYVPSGEVDFTAEGSGITIGTDTSPTVRHYLPPDSTSGFWLLVLDRSTLQAVNDYNAQATTAFECNPAYLSQNCGMSFDVKSDGGKKLAAVLGGIDSRKLVFLTTTSCPFDSNDQIDSSLGDALQKLGGVSYSLNGLTTTAGTCKYTLVTVNDGAHQLFTSKVALSADQFSANGQSGILHGYLALDRKGLYDIAAKDQGIVKDDAVQTIDYAYEHIVSQPRQNWPLTDTAEGLMAYYDISYQLLTDPAIDESGSYLYDVRYFYTDVAMATKLAGLIDSRLGPKATNPVTPSSWDTATNATFTQARDTIMAELQQISSTTGYLTGSDGMGGVRGLLAGTNTHILADAVRVASDIGKDQDDAAQQTVNGNMSDMLNLLAGLTSAVGPILGAADSGGGVILGVMSGMLWTGSAAMTPLDGTTIPGPETSYDVLLSELIGDADDYSTNLQDGFDATVDTILSDPGKLAQVGALTSNSDSGWSLANLVSPEVLSASIQSGARMSLWLDVLPNLYGVRTASAKDSDDPATYGSWVFQSEQYKTCEAVYTKSNSGGVPAETMTQNYHIGDGESTKWDVSLIAEGKTVTYPTDRSKLKDPSMSQNLGTLLTTSQSVTMPSGNQVGLNIPRQLLLNSGPFVTSSMAYFNDSPSWYCDASQ